jgi:hypothetical protein
MNSTPKNEADRSLPRREASSTALHRPEASLPRAEGRGVRAETSARPGDRGPCPATALGVRSFEIPYLMKAGRGRWFVPRGQVHQSADGCGGSGSVRVPPGSKFQPGVRSQIGMQAGTVGDQPKRCRIGTERSGACPSLPRPFLAPAAVFPTERFPTERGHDD